jgi:hypothetical protein
MSTLIRCTGLLLVLLVFGCTTSGNQLERSLKAATSRSTGCPAKKLSISQHTPRLRSWKASGCRRTYSCVSINLEMELADCQSNAVANAD